MSIRTFIEPSICIWQMEIVHDMLSDTFRVQPCDGRVPSKSDEKLWNLHKEEIYNQIRLMTAKRYREAQFEDVNFNRFKYIVTIEYIEYFGRFQGSVEVNVNY